MKKQASEQQIRAPLWLADWLKSVERQTKVAVLVFLPLFPQKQPVSRKGKKEGKEKRTKFSLSSVHLQRKNEREIMSRRLREVCNTVTIEKPAINCAAKFTAVKR